MDKKKGILNVTVSVAFRVLLLFGGIFVRRYLIKYTGNEINGLNALFLSIIGFLSVAELGMGNAITFCMYKPIVEADRQKVSALYHLLSKIYTIISGVIFGIGIGVMPFLPYLARGYQNIDVNLYSTFFLMLVSVVLTYFYSSKISLINAYKNDYITTTITSLGNLLQYALQIIAVVYFRSFVAYLVSRIIAVSFQWVLTEIIGRKKYAFVIKNKAQISQETKKEVLRNVKAMFMHKVGYVLVNTVDSLIISAFIGVEVLGRYSNYTTIMTSMIAVINLFFTPLTSIIGHLFAEGDKEKTKSYYNFFYGANYMVGAVFFLGYYAVINGLITICFGDGLEVSSQLVFVITVNYFIQFMRRSTLVFRDATGVFYNDRWKPLVEGSVNVVLSILLAKVIGTSGVIVATILTNLAVCHVIEPYVLHKNAFNTSPKKFMTKNYLFISLFVCCLAVFHWCMTTRSSEWAEIIVNGCMSLVFSAALCIVMAFFNKDFCRYAARLLKRK